MGLYLNFTRERNYSQLPIRCVVYQVCQWTTLNVIVVHNICGGSHFERSSLHIILFYYPVHNY